MVSETMTDIQRRIRATGSGVLLPGAALCAAGIWLAGCGSNGNSITCGKGTTQKGNTCIAEAPIVDEPDASAGGSPDTGGSGNGGGGAGTVGGAGGSMGGTGGDGPVDSGTTEDVLGFKGMAPAGPGAATPAEG